MKIRNALLYLFVPIASIALMSLLAAKNQPQQEEENELLVSLGINNNSEVVESSGLACSRTIANSIWTVNDSGNSPDLLLLKTDGTLQASVSIKGATNVDWEAMAGFKVDKRHFLIVADVGDNSGRRKDYQLYLLREPDLLAELKRGRKLPIRQSVEAQTIHFTYEDGPKDCEAIGVDVAGKQIWLVEKVFYDSSKKTPPGIYTLPLSLPQAHRENRKPLVAKRIADFPPRSVTGMDFSPDGKRLIIRNYVNAHLYSRDGDETWESVVAATNPSPVVLPLQRQGEAICFTLDSKSVILTSEFKRQPIWQVNLVQAYEQHNARNPKKPVDH